MANLLISIVATAVLAVLFHAWLCRYEDCQVAALHRWADSAGWRVRAAPVRSTLPASWPEHPSATWGTPSVSLDGEHDGYPLILEWISGDSKGDAWSATICYTTLRRDHPTSTPRRRPFARKAATAAAVRGLQQPAFHRPRGPRQDLGRLLADIRTTPRRDTGGMAAAWPDRHTDPGRNRGERRDRPLCPCRHRSALDRAARSWVSGCQDLRGGV